MEDLLHRAGSILDKIDGLAIITPFFHAFGNWFIHANCLS